MPDFIIYKLLPEDPPNFSFSLHLGAKLQFSPEPGGAGGHFLIFSLWFIQMIEPG